MVLETEPRIYADWKQFELLKKKKRLGQLPTTQLTTPLWLNNRQARELGYDATEGEDFLLEPGLPEPKALFGRIPQPDIKEPSVVSRVEPPVVKAPKTIQGDAPGVGGAIDDLLKRLYPESFLPGASYGYKPEQMPAAVLANLRGQIQENPDEFLNQLMAKNMPAETSALLTYLGVPQQDIDQMLGTPAIEQALTDAISAISRFKGYNLETFAERVESDPDEFIKQLQVGGWTREKENLLRLMWTPDEEISRLLPPWWTLDYWKNAFFQPYGGKDIKGKLAASFIAGVGDVIKTTGGVARWLGFEQAGSILSTIGSTLGQVAPPDTTGEFAVSDLLNPDWYATKVVRTIPFALSLLPLALGGFASGSAVATAVGVGRIGSLIIGGFASAGLSRPLESAYEAGGIYDDAIARGKTEAEAKKEADEVFRNNMTLAGADAFEIAIALAPTPKWVPISLVKAGLVRTARISGKMVIVGLSEGGEELYQDMITRHAAGEEWQLDPMSKEVFAIGMVMGVGGGLGGDVMSGVVDKAQSKMSKSLREQFIRRIVDFKAEGFTTEQAEARALDEIAQTAEGEKVVSEAIKAIQPEPAVIKAKKEVTPPIPEVKPPSVEEPSVKEGIPFMITRQMETHLKAKDYTQVAIDKMTPQEAHSILAVPEKVAPVVSRAELPAPEVTSELPISKSGMTLEEFKNWDFKVPEGGASKTPKTVLSWDRTEYETLYDLSQQKDIFRFEEALGKGWKDWKPSLHLREQVKRNEPITVYRASDTGDIVPGSYVSESLEY